MDRLLHPVQPSASQDDERPAADLGEFSGKTVLIVGAGGSARDYSEDIELFIEQHEPLVLTLNHQTALSLDRVDGIICVDQHRLLYEAEFLATCEKPIYTAARLLNPTIGKILEKADLRQYDCLIQEGTFAAHEGGCVIPEPLAIAYALALCVSGKVKRVFLVGFDGFSADDSRQQQMLNVLRLAEPHFGAIEMTALTPTSYPIAQGSIYADYR
jgi:4-hydroxy 2-oxovalerate aldolase